MSEANSQMVGNAVILSPADETMKSEYDTAAVSHQIAYIRFERLGISPLYHDPLPFFISLCVYLEQIV